MTIKPGHLYNVSISDRGSGIVKAIRQDMHKLVDATVMHGRFKDRVVKGRVRVDGDILCFYATDETVTIKPLELDSK